MYAASAQFVAAMAGPHQRVVTADAYYGGALVAAGLNVVDGSVTLDIDQDIQGTLRLTVAAPDGALVPKREADALAPYGSEIALRCGVQFPDGSIETLAYGRYVIGNVDVRENWIYTEAGTSKAAWRHMGAQIDVNADDRMATIRRAALLNKSTPGNTAQVVSQLRELVGYIIPIRQLPTSSVTVPNDVVYNSEAGSRLAAIKAIVPDNWAYWIDRDGAFNCVINPATTPAPAATFAVGPSGSVLTFTATLTNEQTYNGVIARGQNEVDLGTIKGEAYIGGDNPTRWNGPFGQAPYFMGGLLASTKAELDSAARTRLAGLIAGRDRVITASLPPDARLDLNDIVRLTLPDRTFTGRVTSIQFPLAPGGGAMTVSLRVAEDAVINSGQGAATLLAERAADIREAVDDALGDFDKPTPQGAPANA